MQPLAGVRALELGQYTAGPYCGRMLATLGAEVVKAEPRKGEPLRQLQPQTAGDGYLFHLNNVGKRSITLDITHPHAPALFHRLAAVCDVVVENFSLGVAARRGIDYEQARRANSEIVYCSIKGFGASGPMAERVAYDAVIQAEAGVMDATRSSTGLPIKAGISISDLLGATLAAAKIVTALVDRRRNARGAFLDVSLFQASAWACLTARASSCQAAGRTASIARAANAELPFRQLVKATDGSTAIELTTDAQIQALRALAEASPLQGSAGSSATDAQHSFVETIRRWASTKTAADVEQACTSAGIPAGKLLRIDQAITQPHAAARGILGRAYAEGQEVIVNAMPLVPRTQEPSKLIGSPGADNAYVYGELLGIDEPARDALSESGVI
jgi:CoA:oxalate CoA-transferase